MFSGYMSCLVDRRNWYPFACFQVATPPWDDVGRMSGRVNCNAM